MTKLSELLPSGGGAKEFSAVASGTLSSGQTIGLKSNGTVEAIAISSAGATTQANFTSTNALQMTPGEAELVAVHDVNKDRVIIFYNKDSDDYIYATAYTPTATGLTNPGPEKLIRSAALNSRFSAVYNSNDQKSVFAFIGPSYGANGGYALVVEVAAATNTITIGNAAQFTSVGVRQTQLVYDSTAQKVVLLWSDKTNDEGSANVITITGTTITYGSTGIFAPSLGGANYGSLGVAYESVSNTVTVCWGKQSDSYNATFVVGQVSGTSINFGVQKTFATSSSYYKFYSTTDTVTNQVVTSYLDTSNNPYMIVITPTSNPNTGTYGATFTPDFIWNTSSTMAFSPIDNKISVASPNLQSGTGATPVYNWYGSVSGTTLSGSSFDASNSGLAKNDNVYNIYISSINKNLIVYGTGTNYQPHTGNYVIANPEQNNVTSFIGITSEAIASTATGKINPQGGVATPSISLTTGSTYYVQTDGTISPTSSTVTAGKAISTTQLILKGAS